jgi:DNA-binding PadR family transcriptional regulator
MKKLTRKQSWIIDAILAGIRDEDGVRAENLDVYQLMDRVPYQCSREAMLCSLRFLKKHGLVETDRKENRNGRMHQVFMPTDDCIRIYTKRLPDEVHEEEDLVVETFW